MWEQLKASRGRSTGGDSAQPQPRSPAGLGAGNVLLPEDLIGMSSSSNQPKALCIPGAGAQVGRLHLNALMESSIFNGAVPLLPRLWEQPALARRHKYPYTADSLFSCCPKLFSVSHKENKAKRLRFFFRPVWQPHFLPSLKKLPCLTPAQGSEDVLSMTTTFPVVMLTSIIQI